jgi:hypothetical protein
VGTIRYCFCDAGISSGVQEDVVVTEKKDHVDDDGGDDDDLLSSMWMRKLFVAFCDSMATSMMRMQPQMMTLLRSRHKETVREMRSKDGNEAEEPEGNKEEEEEDFEASISALSEALEDVRSVNRCYEATAERKICRRKLWTSKSV